MSFNDVAITFVKTNDYRFHFLYISRDEAIDILKVSDLKEKSGTLTNYKNIKIN